MINPGATAAAVAAATLALAAAAAAAATTLYFMPQCSWPCHSFRV